MTRVRHPYLDHPSPLAFAHRGGTANGLENTAAAFRRAAAMGEREGGGMVEVGVAYASHGRSMAPSGVRVATEEGTESGSGVSGAASGTANRRRKNWASGPIARA